MNKIILLAITIALSGCASDSRRERMRPDNRTEAVYKCWMDPYDPRCTIN